MCAHSGDNHVVVMLQIGENRLAYSVYRPSREGLCCNSFPAILALAGRGRGCVPIPGIIMLWLCFRSEKTDWRIRSTGHRERVFAAIVFQPSWHSLVAVEDVCPFR